MFLCRFLLYRFGVLWHSSVWAIGFISASWWDPRFLLQFALKPDVVVLWCHLAEELWEVWFGACRISSTSFPSSRTWAVCVIGVGHSAFHARGRKSPWKCPANVLQYCAGCSRRKAAMKLGTANWQGMLCIYLCFIYHLFVLCLNHANKHWVFQVCICTFELTFGPSALPFHLFLNMFAS